MTCERRSSNLHAPAAHAPEHGFRHDATSLSGARSMYRLHAPIYDLTRWLFLRRRAEAVRRLALVPGATALEVGCGTGSNLVRMRALAGAAGEVHGLDLSPHMLIQARRKIEWRNWRNVTLHEGDASAFDLGRQFDAILYSYSLSMIPDWRASLAASARHLQPGGRLVILDFGDLAGWGPLAPFLRRWLHAHHVEPGRPFARVLGEILDGGTVEVERGRGGWHLLTWGTRRGI